MDIQNRARGLMVGIGVGSLFGLPYEGPRWDAKRIHRRFGARGVREIAVDSGWPDDDDLAQSILLAEAASQGGDFVIGDLMCRFWEWGELNGLGMGSITKRSLALYGGDRPRRQLRHFVKDGVWPDGDPPREPEGCSAIDAARIAWEEKGRSAASNGAVMRCAPVALRWRDDDSALVRNSIVSAAVTHRDPRCIWAAILVNLAIADCLRGDPVESGDLLRRAGREVGSLGDDARFGIGNQPPGEVADSVAAALDDGAGVAAIDLDHPKSGFVLKTMRAALWCARHPANFEDGLSAIVSAGGDADTNGAIAGACLGARFGLAGIPSHWRERVAEIRACVVDVPNWQCREPLGQLADRLV